MLMETSTEIVIVLISSLMVLVVVGTFLFLKSDESGIKFNAAKIFSTKCESYKAYGCDWLKATRSAGFYDEFVPACKTVNGEQFEAYSCLTKLCCSPGSSLDSNKCESKCQSCSSFKSIGAAEALANCCSSYSKECSTSCEAC